MQTRILLFLSATRFQAQVWKDGILVHQQEFTDNPQERKRFAAFLQAWHAPAFLLTDLIEEDFRHETLLHLRGRERSAQVQRKFEQFYRNTPFRQATLHQRQREGRRDDEMLFSALTNPGLIQPWLDIVLQQHIPLTGIYSVPGISRPLIDNIHADHILLLSWEKHAGLRQTYFNAKRLYLSRLTPVNDGQPFSELVAAEVARTQQYLKSLSLMPLGQMLQVHILCHERDRLELQSKLHNAGDMSYAYLDIQEMGARFKTEEDYPDSDATHLLLHLLATQPPSTHYAGTEHTRFFWLWQANRRLLWLSALAAFAGLSWSAINLWEGSRMNADRAVVEAQQQRVAQQTRQLVQGFPSRLASAADMKSAVTSFRKLDAYAPPPEEIWAGLSSTLQDFPRIRIDRLSWQNGAAGANIATGAANPEVPVMMVSGRLEGWDHGYRNSLDYLNRFQQALKQHYDGVSALSLPLDISPHGSIVDSTLENDGKPASFSLQITWKQPQ